jgi:hypothetical protein
MNEFCELQMMSAVRAESSLFSQYMAKRNGPMIVPNVAWGSSSTTSPLPHQHAQRRHQHALGLVGPHGPAAPALAEGPGAQAHSAADHVPHHRAGGAVVAAEHRHGVVHTLLGQRSPLGEVHLERVASARTEWLSAARRTAVAVTASPYSSSISCRTWASSRGSPACMRSSASSFAVIGGLRSSAAWGRPAASGAARPSPP